MAPNEPMNTVGIKKDTASGMNAAKAASTICFLAGIWLFVSPWVYGVSTSGGAWNCWIVGGLIILFGIIRMARPAFSTALSWCNMILGIWVFFSPWIYGYATTNTGRLVNSLCVGVIVFVFSIASATASRRRNVIPLDRPFAP